MSLPSLVHRAILELDRQIKVFDMFETSGHPFGHFGHCDLVRAMDWPVIVENGIASEMSYPSIKTSLETRANTYAALERIVEFAKSVVKLSGNVVDKYKSLF
jgi:hypothetical protein